MSTKTTFKRVALVAVAALGFGVLTSVAPAMAANPTPTAITVGSIPLGQVGVLNRTPVTITVPSTTTTDSFLVTVKVTSAPVGSAFRTTLGQNYQADGTTAACASIILGCVAPGSSTVANLTLATGTATVANATQVTPTQASATPLLAQVSSAFTTSGYTTTYNTSSVINVDLTPDVAGSYTIQVSARNMYDGGTLRTAAGTSYTAGDANATYTVSTSAAAASMTLAAVTGASTTSSDVGQLIKLTLKDSAGLAAQLATGESVAVTAAGTGDSLKKVTVTNGKYVANTANAVTADTTLALTNADFINGVAYFNLKNSAASTGLVITAVGAGTLSTAITATLTTTVKTATTDIAGAALTVGDSTTRVGTRPGSGHTATTAGTPATSTSSLTVASHSFDVAATLTTAATDAILDTKVVDTAGYITGIAGQVYNTYTTATYDATVSTTVAYGVLSVSATCATAGACFTATLLDSAGTWGTTASDGVTVTSAAPAATTNTAGPATTIRQAHGATTVLGATLTDQFGAAMASQAVTVVTTGRNATASAALGITDALGYISYSRTDAGTAATVSTADVVTITSGGVATSAITINYAATNGASSITCLTGNEDDTSATITYRDIDASSKAGAAAGAASLCTLTIKDVNGSILTGVPVTVTTASAGAAVKSTSATTYTGALGTVTPSVYAWTAGTKTFTITAGTVTKTVTVNYRQGGAVGTDNPTEVRTIAAVASGNSIAVTAKDRFGNPVQGVPLYASRTGNGLFGGGSNTASATTDAAGSAEFIFNAGSADSVVTITAGSLTAAAVAYGQTSSAAGALCVGVDCVSEAFTATTVGTSTVAETGVGASLSPAGVGSVTVAVAAGTDTGQTATDAAAEATDAANAATDAANAAAEAADAATAAAQDAADAVAALSAQVSTMMASLKAQLTALTNLVIKIQKKVKA